MANEKDTLGITVKKLEDMPEWYTQVILKAELADYSKIKGCMVIRPNGYSIWQKIQDFFNVRLKTLEVRNAYFPMFIPESFFKKEAEHAKGFSPEVAWVEKKDDEGGERLALRPTSETIMYDSYSKWIRSWRDLPLRINQWCNIVRWEVSDVKLFLRSREFLWQEGHCVYATEEECEKEVMLVLEEYRKIAEELLSIPVILGRKTDKEKFAGAVYTTTMEAFMPDGKALQLATSHHLGQGFAKVFGIRYLNCEEKETIPHQNSWGFSTRLIGATVMIHSDDKGLVLPPRVAPIKVVIVPILFEKTKQAVLSDARKILEELNEFDAKLDDRDEYTAGWKYNEWEVKGVPIRIEFGPKDLEKRHAVLVRRDTGEKSFVKLENIKQEVEILLNAIQENLYDKAKKDLTKNIIEVDNWKDFLKAIEERKLVFCPFCGDAECEEGIKEKTGGATSRCIPFEQEKINKKCVHCENPAHTMVYFAKNY